MANNSQGSSSNSNDPWTAKSYQASSSFVPLLTTQVVQWLDPQPHERILDLGCGDGILTAKIKQSCAYVLGLDGSPNLIEAAKADFGHISGIEWEVKDCRYLNDIPSTSNPSDSLLFDKIFSNAALHWILHDASTRRSVLQHCFRLLKPSGTFVFEMGGAGNVAEIHTALIQALVHHGIPLETARGACPWFFPSETQMRAMLTAEGFEVERAELQYRPTQLTDEEGGGLEGWIKLHGDSFLRVVPQERREDVVREVSAALKSVITREEWEAEGGMWIGYVRLRVLARKPR